MFTFFQEGSGQEVKKKRGMGRRGSVLLKPTWKENNNAERIFNLLPERDARCYSALIRGMVKVRTRSLLILPLHVHQVVAVKL